jgi:ABC-type sugar transport system substrate-binding protein
VGRRVVVSLITQDQEFQRLQAADARESADRLGLAAEILFADNNAVLQIQQLFRCVHAEEAERPAAIVTETVTGEGLERVARSAVKAGIAWILLNRRVAYMDALRRERPDLAIAMVGTDQEEVGRIQARQWKALLPRGGAVLYVQGPPDTSVAQERLHGAEEGLRGARIELKVVSGDWTEASGEKAVAAWLRLKTSEGLAIGLVGSQNDAMALGARNCVLASKPDWGHVRFTGCDGLPEGGRRLVDQGALAATIVTPSNVGPALERVAAWLDGGRVPPRDVLLEPRSYPPEQAIRP